MNSMKLNKLAGSIAGAGLLAAFSFNVFAAPQCPESLDPAADYKCVFIDTGTDYNSDGDSVTSAFYELGYTSTLATSIYTLTPTGIPATPFTILDGSPIIDTNIASVLNSYGVLPGSNNYTNLLGVAGAVNLNGSTPTLAQRNIDELNPLGSPDDGLAENDSEAFNQLGGWRLYYDYYLEGTFSTTLGPTFTNGYFLVYFDEIGGALDNTQILRVNLTGSQLDSANLTLLGTVSYDFDDDGIDDCTTTFCQNFWNFQTGSSSWYSAFAGGIEIAMKLDTNVNPPIPTAGQLGVTSPDGVNFYAVRQTTLDGSIRFNVPEPTTLGLLGIGLLGAGMRFGRKRVA